MIFGNICVCIFDSVFFLFLEADSWTPDNWAPGLNCPGPNCPRPNCPGPNLPRTKSWGHLWDMVLMTTWGSSVSSFPFPSFFSLLSFRAGSPCFLSCFLLFAPVRSSSHCFLPFSPTVCGIHTYFPRSLPPITLVPFGCYPSTGVFP